MSLAERITKIWVRKLNEIYIGELLNKMFTISGFTYSVISLILIYTQNIYDVAYIWPKDAKYVLKKNGMHVTWHPPHGWIVFIEKFNISYRIFDLIKKNIML